MEDFLDEDIEIRNQKFCVLSYTLPPPGGDPKGKKRAGYDTPMIKIRGSYATEEECESRIETLKKTDKYFHMYVSSVGVWGPLLNEEQHKEAGTAAVYMNKDMNEFMKGYKESQERKNEEFENRKRDMVEKAKFDGSKEGQKLLAEKKENPISVRERINMSENAIKDLEEKLKEMRDIHTKAVELFATYTNKEIEEAEREIHDNNLKIKEM